MKKIYWDSSALIGACQDDQVKEVFLASDAVTRSHSFTEMFSTLTGSRLGYRVDSDDAAALIAQLAGHLSVADLNGDDVLEVLSEARSRGVRGGQVHDLIHAAAAVDAGCDVVATYNLGDFKGLYDDLQVVLPQDLFEV